MLHKPGPQLYITDWLSRHNHETNRDEEITGMGITINTIASCTHMPEWMTSEEIRIATLENKHIGILSELIICSGPSTKADVQKNLQPYWLLTDETAIYNGTAMRA